MILYCVKMVANPPIIKQSKLQSGAQYLPQKPRLLSKHIAVANCFSL